MISSTTADEERRLWCSVIERALEDARGRLAGAGTTNPVTLNKIIKDAHKWLTIPNRDFDEVCHLAGLDPDAVRERARLALKAGGSERFQGLTGTGDGRHA